MKKILLGVFALLFAVSITACRDTEKKAEDAAQTVEEATQDAVQEVEEAKVEAVEAVEEAAEEVEGGTE
ncbi:MAG: hypothetical protein COZ75_12045 [Flavobacteriaceae bacterium CG_4_8_14_3_um_filter_34_10]|nr:hypothetical protein [Flavobacteriia bacterium]OIP51905.1 MAG: hypothetical protein AUK33_02745 [Flavobacteriaceae bacterium CG2_30_34_30]PIQ18624.1 MAG: hypothetical protein COW66_05545 [Flavobacteriaceae bacterium CG18_big_fil_WC_8_21_14_2_50_34_36]PIV49577.1 MAG: hypothetical protein COS19_07880 [Flavobacteriaceae bacterium CG02_land_8_20_14_3_00_34_13]PIX08431.1 MAG: hypothetical protein COZ75_12045 [Flavobacteriaceae bacterium CG_4_8_14_3_um_filter_34_10]PIZ09180.1 MAG: hypothetical pr